MEELGERKQASTPASQAALPPVPLWQDFINKVAVGCWSTAGLGAEVAFEIKDRVVAASPWGECLSRFVSCLGSCDCTGRVQAWAWQVS